MVVRFVHNCESEARLTEYGALVLAGQETCRKPLSADSESSHNGEEDLNQGLEANVEELIKVLQVDRCSLPSQLVDFG